MTEFLGTDQGGELSLPGLREQPPYLFGTAVIDPNDIEEGEEPWFYQSWQEAADGHRLTVEQRSRRLGMAPPALRAS